MRFVPPLPRPGNLMHNAIDAQLGIDVSFGREKARGKGVLVD
jgi:hypothetical protein